MNDLNFEGTPHEFHQLLNELSKKGSYMGIERMRQVEKLDENELKSVPIETDNIDICQATLMVNEKYDISKLPKSLRKTIK